MLALQNLPNLAHAGWESIGSGCYGNVFGNDKFPDRVLKQATKGRDGSYSWLAWCALNQHRRGVPIIHNMVMLPGDMFMCEMDRYIPMEYGKKGAHAIEGITMGPRRECACVVRPYNREEWWDTFGYSDCSVYPRELEGKAYQKRKSFIELGYGYVVELMEAFEKETGLVCNDVHHGNIMWCAATQTIIVTDPISSIGGDEYDPSTAEDRPDFELVMQ